MPIASRFEELANDAISDYPANPESSISLYAVDKAAKAQAEIILHPGHATYFAERMEEERATAVRRNQLMAEVGLSPNWIAYDRFRSRTFMKLSRMRSAEAVGVLGKMLQDDRDAVSEEDIIENPLKRRGVDPSSILAARALMLLGIQSPPAVKPSIQVGYDDVEVWRSWFEEVKTGTRTFRFKGNPQNYSLTGPVDKERHPALAATPASRHREAASRPGAEAPKSVESNKTPLIAVAAVCLALLAGLVAVLKKRPQPTT